MSEDLDYYRNQVMIVGVAYRSCTCITRAVCMSGVLLGKNHFCRADCRRQRLYVYKVEYACNIRMYKLTFAWNLSHLIIIMFSPANMLYKNKIILHVFNQRFKRQDY